MKNFRKYVASGVLALALSVGTAFAATVTSVNADNATLTALAPTSLSLSNGASWVSGNTPATVSGSQNGVYRSPFENLGGQGGGAPFANAAGTIQYWNVGPSVTAVMNISSLRSTFSMLWGSPDSYNTIRLINTVAGTSESFSLASLTNVPPTTPGRGAMVVTIKGFMFDRVEFRSGSPALEMSNVAAVPLPAGAVLLLSALGGMFVLRRRRSALAA